MKRVLDCLIDQGADWICILANFLEQFLRTISYFGLWARGADASFVGVCCWADSGDRDNQPLCNTDRRWTRTVCKRSWWGHCDYDAPYHGALLKGTAQQTFKQFSSVSEVGIPIMVQNAPLSGVDLPTSLLVQMACEIEMVKLFKIECPRAANKIWELIALGCNLIEAPFNGEEAITLLADLDAGAIGTMTSGMIVDQIKPVLTAFHAGHVFIRQREPMAGLLWYWTMKIASVAGCLVRRRWSQVAPLNLIFAATQSPNYTQI